MATEKISVLRGTWKRFTTRIQTSLSPGSGHLALITQIFLFSIAFFALVLVQRHMQSNLIRENALQQATQYSKSLKRFRRLYASTVVSTAQEHGLKIVSDFEGVKGAIPLPITLTKLLGNQLADNEGGGRVQLYSPYPFPSNREPGGLHDYFSRDAWTALERDPDTPFFSIEEIDGKPILRYATADIMQSSCIDCHNNHPDTPKNDWKVGDLRGVLEVSVPLDAATLRANADTREFTFLIAGLSLLGVLCITNVLRRNRRSSRELERLVEHRTADLTNEIKERSNVEEALRNNEARTRAIVESAAEGIVVIDEQGIVESINGAAAKMFQYLEEEVVGRNVSMLLPSPDAEQHDEYLARYLRSGQAKIIGTGGQDVNGKRKDGSIFPIHLAVSEVKFSQRRIFTGVLHDLTERKQLERELSQAQKLESIGQLSAGVAHEINTPMQYIGDNLEFLDECMNNLLEVVDTYQQRLEDKATAQPWEHRIQELSDVKKRCKFDSIREQVPQAIQESLEGVERVIHIVRAMKQFSHPGSSKKVLSNINDAIRNTATITKNRWKYVAELELELDPDLTEAMVLTAALNQVLLNLMVNASDAIAEKQGEQGNQKGMITVRTRNDSDSVVIEVEDTGCGIPDEIVDRVFDPFFTTKDVGKGTGQGLAISRDVIVNKHNGTLEVLSTPGEGTTFIVRLPISPSTDNLQEGSQDIEREDLVEQPLITS